MPKINVSTICCILITLCFVLTTTGHAAIINWADWTDSNDKDGLTAYGTITTTTSIVKITYNNPQGVGFFQATGGADFWTGGGKRDPATSPYTSDFVENIPTGSDIVALQYAGTQTLFFSEKIANPVFSFVSLNGNGYAFDQDFEILSFGNSSDGNECGYWGCGTSYKEVVDLGNGRFEYRLLGTGEPHGSLRFTGAFDKVTWSSLSNEYWNGFTVGIEGTALEIFPETTKEPEIKYGTLKVSGEGAGLVAPGYVELILDASGSMRGRTRDGQRKIDVAKDVLQRVVRNLPGDISAALRVYGHRLPREPKPKSCLDTELLTSFAPLQSSSLLQTLPGISPQGQTPIGLSLAKLVDDFGDLPGPKLVVLVSDGIETCNTDSSDPLYPPSVIQDLMTKGIDVRINVVGFDIDAGETQSFLEELAQMTSGRYFSAGSTRELEQSLQQALSAPFTVKSSSGEVIAEGSVGKEELKLPVGTYDLDVLSTPPVTIESVVITEQQTEIRLRATSEGVKIERHDRQDL
jgi:hypothetical protein